MDECKPLPHAHLLPQRLSGALAGQRHLPGGQTADHADGGLVTRAAGPDRGVRGAWAGGVGGRGRRGHRGGAWAGWSV